MEKKTEKKKEDIMEAFLRNRKIKYVPLLIVKRYEEDGVRKDMVDGRRFGIDGLRCPKYNDWYHNEDLFNEYENHKQFVNNQYQTRLSEHLLSEDNRSFPELIFAHDTRTYGILDFDHVDELNRPEAQRLLHIAPYYESYVKHLPKIFVEIKDLDSRQYPSRIVIHTKNGKTTLELLIGQFSYFTKDQRVYNADQPFPVYNSITELLNIFGYEKDFVPKKVCNDMSCKRQKVSPNLDHSTKSFVYNRILSFINRLIAIDPTWGNSYDNWMWMGFVLYNIFCDVDINMGLELFDIFSQSTKCYDADEVESKWEDIERGVDRYNGIPINESSLLRKVEELEEVKGISKPRLLLTSSSSTSSATETCSETDIDQDESNIFYEIENVLEMTSPTIIRQAGFKKLLMKVIHNLDDTEEGYQMYKKLLMNYGKIDFSDSDLGKLSTAWRKVQSLPSHTIKLLLQYVREQNPDDFETKYLKNKETYDKVKEKFERTCAKIRNPVCFVDINSDGKIQVMLRKDIQTNYENLMCMMYSRIDGKITKHSFIGRWFFDETMRTYDRMDFNPDTSDNTFVRENMTFLNMFRGLECMNYKKYPSIAENEMNGELDLFLWLIRHQLCDDNESFYTVFIKLLAHAIQKPGQKWGIMVIIKSIEGIGKGMFVDFFGHCILGQQYYQQVDNADTILGNFNESRMNKLFINMNELRRSDLSEKQGALKSAITENTVQINQKGKPVITIRNETNYLITTNNDVPVPVGLSDRRMMAIESHAQKLPVDKALRLLEFVNIKNKNSKFIAKFRDFLLNIDLTGFVPQQERVETAFYREMREIMIPHHILFLHHFFFVQSWRDQYKSTKSTKPYREWKEEYLSHPIKSGDLYDKFLEYRREHMNDNSRYTQNALSRHLKKLANDKAKIADLHHFKFDLTELASTLETTYHMTIPEKDLYESSIDNPISEIQICPTRYFSDNLQHGLDLDR